MHGVVLHHARIELGRDTGLCACRLAAGEQDLASLVGGSDLAFEDLHLGVGSGHPHREFGAFDHAVHVGRVDRHGAWRATEGLERTHHQIEQAALFGAGADIHQTQGGVLIETQHCIVDQLQRSATIGADPHRIAFAELGSEGRFQPDGLISVGNFDGAFQCGEAARPGRAFLRHGRVPWHDDNADHGQHLSS